MFSFSFSPLKKKFFSQAGEIIQKIYVYIYAEIKKDLKNKGGDFKLIRTPDENFFDSEQLHGRKMSTLL